MKRINAVFKRELQAYFDSAIAYIFIVVFLAAANLSFYSAFFIMNTASLKLLFNSIPVLFLFLIPAVTMRSWAEERGSETIEILLTLPARDLELVIGKFLASLTFVAFCLALTFPTAISVAWIGDLDWGPVIGGYLASLLLGAVYLSIGSFISCLNRNQVSAFILTFTVILSFILVGQPFITMRIPPALSSITPVFMYLDISQHFRSICRGVIDMKDVIYYLSLIFFFLYLNTSVLSSRMWR